MIKQNFEIKDLQGGIIDQPMKTGKSVEIDGNSNFCGHRFLLKQKLYGDKRCIYCGKWFHWCQEDSQKWIKAENIDNTNIDKVLEPLHCGNSHCSDYHERYLRHQTKLAKQNDDLQEYRMNEMFKWGKKVGLI